MERTRWDTDTPYVRPVSRALAWSEEADILLASASKEELLELAKVASRVQIQALVQYGQAPQYDPRDHELLTPAEIVTAFKVSRWSVCEAIRRGELVPWRPHPKATRGLKVPRGVAKVWARGR